MRMILRWSFRVSFLCLAIALFPSWAGAQEQNYKLALIRRKADPRVKMTPSVEVYKLSAKGEVLSTATLRTENPPSWVFPSGKILHGSHSLRRSADVTRREFTSTDVARISAPVPSGQLDQVLSGTSGAIVDVWGDAEPETVLKHDDLTSSCVQFLAGRNLIKPQGNPLFSFQILGFESYAGSFALRPPLSHSETMRTLIVQINIEDKDYDFRSDRGYPVFGQQYFNRFDILLLRDISRNTWEHICGSEKERFFFGHSVDMLNGKVIFYRAKNYMSIAACSNYEAPIIATEGGYEVCMYDTSSGKLEVLTDKGYRDLGPGPILWSPDGSRFLFEHAEEWFYGDQVHNEFAGPYVYDCATKKHYRPTSKYPIESAICWLPDSMQYLVSRGNPLKPLQERPCPPQGFFVVNVLTKEEYSLLPLTDDPECAEVPGREDKMRSPGSFAFSPDGRCVSFNAYFDQGGIEYWGLFMMRNEANATPILVDKTRLERDDKGRQITHYDLWFSTWLR